MNQVAKLLPIPIAALAALYLLAAALPPFEFGSEMQIHRAGKLPVQYRGRIKPLDTLARNSLMIISDRQTYRDGDGKRQPAIRWLLDVMFDPEAAAQHKVFRIVNDEVIGLLGLDKERKGFRYSLAEISRDDNLAKLQQESERIREVKEPGVYEKQLQELAQQIHLYMNLEGPHRLPDTNEIEDPRELAAWLKFQQRFASELEVEGRHVPRLIPPTDDGPDWSTMLGQTLAAFVDIPASPGDLPKPPDQGGDWKDYIDAFISKLVDRPQYHPVLPSAVALGNAYRDGDVLAFNQSLERYEKAASAGMTAQTWRNRTEAWFNSFAPFYHCSVLYVFVFLLACFGWLVWRGPLHWSAYALLVLVLLIHTGALVVRMFLEGRPPVTNLYSSAIFIGWVAVLLAAVIELIYRNGFATVVGSTVGFLTLIIAHNLADGDTMELMRAVLDTNFWLSTHVTTVTIGYAATYFAGFLAIAFILIGVLTPLMDRDVMKVLGQMIYGIICFATLFSFVGTVLGGIWADQSWGRFWGWDPKENGAMIIVLWNALILHARWGGMVRQRGMAVLAIFGNVVTSWSWFGVNMLGVGLHSYGFLGSAPMWLCTFVGTQLLMMGAGCVPLRFWLSYSALNAPAAPRRPLPPGLAPAQQSVPT